MNTRTHIDTPSLPLLRRASTLIAMGTVGLALVAAGPASADSKPVKQPTTTTTTTTAPLPLVRPAVRDLLTSSASFRSLPQ